MSIGIKLAGLLAAIVGVTALLAWLVLGRAVITPFAKEVMNAHLDQVLWVADQIAAGRRPESLERELKLEIRVLRHRPRMLEKGREHGGCEDVTYRERTLTVCMGPRTPVVIETTGGFVIVMRDLDLGRMRRRITSFLFIVAGIVIAVSILGAIRLTRPLRESVRAMERMASGDLAHRLKERGGREFIEVARAFNTMADRVERLLRVERELMAGISHELRTPLARLRLEIEMLRDREIPEARLLAMEADLEEVDHLIGESLELSRLEIGDREIAHDIVDLASVVAQAIASHPLPRHRLVIEGHATPVVGDARRLERVVGNLLENAGKYAPDDTTIRVTLDGNTVEVADEGPGVSSEERERMFEPFYRGVRSKGASGLGLGLMIVHRIVSLHAGSIHAANRPEGGLAVRFSIPIAETRGEQAGE